MARFIPVFAVLALVVAGCGGSSSPQSSTDTVSHLDAQQAVLQAGAKTRAAKSARIRFTAKFLGGPASGTMTGEGAFAGRRGRMSMDLGGLGNGELTGRIEAIFDGLVFYMKFPPQIAEQLPGGKTWVKFDLAQLGKAQGIDFEQLMQLSGSGPSQSLELLRAASPDFAAVGDEEVRGLETTHYRGTVDLEKVAEQAPANARESYRRIIELTGQRRIPVDVWIDDAGLTRRVRYEQKLPGGSSMEITQELYDFGVQVDVEPPPAVEVVDLTELLGGTGS